MWYRAASCEDAAKKKQCLVLFVCPLFLPRKWGGVEVASPRMVLASLRTSYQSPLLAGCVMLIILLCDRNRS